MSTHSYIYDWGGNVLWKQRDFRISENKEYVILKQKIEGIFAWTAKLILIAAAF